MWSSTTTSATQAVPIDRATTVAPSDRSEARRFRKNMAMTRKRFHLQDDFVLLREVIKHNPFEDPDRWMNVVHTLRKETLKEFTVRGAKERMDLLLSQWSDTDAKERLKSRSATHEQYLEKEKLLQQVFDMEQQVYPKPRRVLYPRPRLKKRDVDPQTVVSPLGTTENSNGVVCHIVSYPDTYPVPETDPHDSVPTEFIEGYSLAGADPSVSSGEDTMEHGNRGAKRKCQDERQEFLERQVDREQTIKEKELQLEERRLKLDEERLAFERTKFEAEMAVKVRRLDMEEEERKIRNDTDKMHLELMKKMFDELVRKAQ